MEIPKTYRMIASIEELCLAISGMAKTMMT
jgi:hypothetical protein